MIISEKDIIQGVCLETEICIIGSGPAGISIALELIKANKKIVILTGGGYHETEFNRDLNKGSVDSNCSHEPLEENRRRVFGGASTAWGGRCIPMDAIDFQKRSWIPNSGWPISDNDLKPYYEIASTYLKTGIFDYNAPTAFKQKQNEILYGIDNEDIISTKIERWSTPVNFAKEFAQFFKNQNNVKVIINSHLITFETFDEKKIKLINAIVGNKKFTIKANFFILACGGIENPRLLLASKNKFHPNGIGNKYDIVGRFYMSHFFGTYATLVPNDRKNIIFNFEKDKTGVYLRRRWWITEKAQHEKLIGNVIFFLHKANDQNGHKDVLFSFVYIAKYFISLISEKSIKSVKAKWIKSKADFYVHSTVILKEGWRDLPQIIKMAFKRFQKRRLPFIIPNVNSEQFGLYFQAEHNPNYDSRITLDETNCDVMGIPYANVKIEFSELDKRTIIESHKIFVDRYIKANLGKVTFSENGLNDFINKKIYSFNSSAHHLGTTRMSNDPAYGVVDKNCLVHGMTNLYVAGSSIFPTGGHVNPTFTIVAMAIRLGEHINKLND
jgi:choline dehydrogenase-like flavoprotein